MLVTELFYIVDSGVLEIRVEKRVYLSNDLTYIWDENLNLHHCRP
jgi:hypothetical protein